MKKTNNKMQLLLLSVVLLGTTACTGDFADINRNPNEVTDEQLQANNYKIGTTSRPFRAWSFRRKSTGFNSSRASSDALTLATTVRPSIPGRRHSKTTIPRLTGGKFRSWI